MCRHLAEILNLRMRVKELEKIINTAVPMPALTLDQLWEEYFADADTGSNVSPAEPTLDQLWDEYFADTDSNTSAAEPTLDQLWEEYFADANASAGEPTLDQLWDEYTDTNVSKDTQSWDDYLSDLLNLK
jgi:hypothetical protein